MQAIELKDKLRQLTIYNLLEREAILLYTCFVLHLLALVGWFILYLYSLFIYSVVDGKGRLRLL